MLSHDMKELLLEFSPDGRTLSVDFDGELMKRAEAAVEAKYLRHNPGWGNEDTYELTNEGRLALGLPPRRRMMEKIALSIFR